MDVPFTSNQRRLGCTRLLGWLDLQKAAAEICVSVSQWLNLVGLLVLGMNPSAGKPMFQHGPVASGSWRYKVEDHIFLQTPSAAACGILSASQGWLQTTDTNTCLSYGCCTKANSTEHTKKIICFGRNIWIIRSPWSIQLSNGTWDAGPSTHW